MSQRVTEEASTPSKAASRFQCSEPGCGRSFSNNSHLRRHSKNHQNARPHKCSVCSKTFVRKEVWRQHVALHSQPRDDRSRVRSATDLENTPDISSSETQQSRPQTPSPFPRLTPNVHSHSRDPALDVAFSESLTSDALELDMADDYTSTHPNAFSPPAITEVQMTDMDRLINDLFGADILAIPSSNTRRSTPVMQDLNSTAHGILHREKVAVEVHSVFVRSIKNHGDERSLQDTKRCLQFFWTEIDPTYPIIHHSSFPGPQTSPLLISSMLVLGASLSSDRVDRSWALTMYFDCSAQAMGYLRAEPTHRLQLLQALVFLSLAGQTLDTDSQHHSQALLSYALTLARRWSLYSPIGYRHEFRHSTKEQQWESWIEEESMRRTVWAIFIRDIEYAHFFYQQPCRAMSPVRSLVQLPCLEELWQASSAAAWTEEYSTQEGYNVRDIIHQCFNNGGSRSHSFFLGIYGIQILKWSLSALAYDVNRRDLYAPDFTSKTKAEINNVLLLLLGQYENKDIFPRLYSKGDSMLSANMTSFLVYVDLQVDTQSLEIFAGATECVRPVRPSDSVLAMHTIQTWSQGNKRELASRCADILVEAMNLSECKTFYHAWAVYMSYLVLWSLWICRDTQMSASVPSPSNLSGQTVMSVSCSQIIAWLDGLQAKPPAACLRAISTGIVSMLMRRPEAIVQECWKLIDRMSLT